MKKKKRELIKTIVIIVLSVALVGETVGLIVSKLTQAPENETQTVLNVDATGVVKTLQPQVREIVDNFTSSLSGDALDVSDIKGSLRKIIYSDTVVSAVMSIAYPLVYDTLDNLGLMEFAENVSLYPTGPQAAPLLKGKGYTACSKTGERKDLDLVLEEAGSDWSYMNSKVKLDAADSDEEAVSLWQTIDWGVSDKDTFYKAMNDMGEILRGALEVGLQGREITVNINVVDYLLSVDAVNVNLDAANIYNADDKAGYANGIVYLLNMLGLDEGEYPAAEEYNAYTNIGDMWKGIFEPVLLAVEKAIDDPLNALPDMLVNFAAATEKGELMKALSSIRMDATYNKLASSVMGFEDGELVNIGNEIVKIIEAAGIRLSGNFNDVLDSIIQLFDKSANLPDMSVSSLTGCASEITLRSGNRHYKADSQKTLDYLVTYAVDEKIVEAVLEITPLKGTNEEKEIINAFGRSKEGIADIAKIIFSIIAKKLG